MLTLFKAFHCSNKQQLNKSKFWHFGEYSISLTWSKKRRLIPPSGLFIKYEAAARLAERGNQLVWFYALTTESTYQNLQSSLINRLCNNNSPFVKEFVLAGTSTSRPVETAGCYWTHKSAPKSVKMLHNLQTCMNYTKCAMVQILLPTDRLRLTGQSWVAVLKSLWCIDVLISLSDWK